MDNQQRLADRVQQFTHEKQTKVGRTGAC